MANSFSTYVGDGSTRLFGIGFPYLNREHVSVTVNGAPVAFTFHNSGAVLCDEPPALGSTVLVSRSTPTSSAVVKFSASTLKDSDLNSAVLQPLYALQELNDGLNTLLRDAQAAAEASGPIAGFYPNKAALTASLPGIQDGLYEVLADESQGGIASRYTVESGVATFQTRLEAITSGILTATPSDDPVPAAFGRNAAAMNAQTRALLNKFTLLSQFGTPTDTGQPISRRFGQSTPPGFIPKIPPNKQRLLSELRALSALPRVQIGNGRRSEVGTRPNQLVFRTLHNASGGTDGTAAVQLRIGAQAASGTNADFRVELDPAHVAGVTVSVIRSSSSGFPSTGLNRTTMTHVGGGVFTLNVASTQPGTPYYGVEVRLLPTDSSSTTALHDQFFLANRVEIKHGGVVVLDTDAAVSGTPFMQLVSASKIAAFKSESINTGTATIYLLHNGCVSGRSSRYLFVAPNVVSGGTGDELDPLSINAGVAAINAGDTDTLLFYPGSYTFAGQRPRAVFAPTGAPVFRAACLDGVATLNLGLPVQFSSLTNNGNGTYSYTYDPAAHYNKNNIIAGNNDAYILLSEHLNQNLYKAAALSEVASRNWSYYFDRASLTFTLRFDGASTGGITICEAGIGIDAGGFELLQSANVWFSGQQAAVVNISSGVLYELYSVRALLGSAVGEVFDIDKCDGVMVDCEGIRSRNDIFNFHGWGHGEMYNCRGRWAQDDAISHHDDCTGYVQGGSFTDSGKSNCIPAFGAFVTTFRVHSAGANKGSSPNAQVGNYGGFVALSADSDVRPTVLVSVQCESDHDQHGVLSSGGRSVAVEYGTKVTASAGAPFASDKWSTHSRGRVVVFDRNISDVFAADMSRVAVLKSES